MAGGGEEREGVLGAAERRGKRSMVGRHKMNEKAGCFAIVDAVLRNVSERRLL